MEKVLESMRKVVGKCVWSRWKVSGSGSGVCGKWARSVSGVCGKCVGSALEVCEKCVGIAPEVLVEAVLEVVGGRRIVRKRQAPVKRLAKMF